MHYTLFLFIISTVSLDEYTYVVEESDSVDVNIVNKGTTAADVGK